MSPRPRLAIYVLTTLALLGAGWWVGGFELLLKADRVHALPFAGFYAALGLVQGWRGKWGEDPVFGSGLLAELAPVFGMTGTLWGILSVIPLAAAHASPQDMMVDLLSSPIATLLGVAVFAYLTIARNVCNR